MQPTFKGVIALVVLSVVATSMALPMAQIDSERVSLRKAEEKLKLIHKARAPTLAARFGGERTFGFSPGPVLSFGPGNNRGAFGAVGGMQSSSPMEMGDDGMANSAESAVSMDSSAPTAVVYNLPTMTDAASQYGYATAVYSSGSPYSVVYPPVATDSASPSLYDNNAGNAYMPPSEISDTTVSSMADSMTATSVYTSSPQATSTVAQYGYQPPDYTPPSNMGDNSGYVAPPPPAYAPPPSQAPDYTGSSQDSTGYESSNPGAYAPPPSSYGSVDMGNPYASSLPSPPTTGYAPPSEDQSANPYAPPPSSY